MLESARFSQAPAAACGDPAAMRNAIHSIYKKTAEAVLPPLAKSQFEEKRVSKGYHASLPRV